MQKKQVKIYGFQSEKDKIRLYYETDGEKSHYVVEKNRKRILITKDLKIAKKKYTNTINTTILQLDIFEQETKKQETIAIKSYRNNGKTRCIKFVEIEIKEYNELWKTGLFKFHGGGLHIKADSNGKPIY